MPAKVNCASAWANHTADGSTQNGESRTATLDISAGIALFVVTEPCRFVSFWSCCSRPARGSPCKFCICVMHCCRRSLPDRCPLFVLYVGVTNVGCRMYVETTTYWTDVEKFIAVAQNIQTNNSTIVCNNYHTLYTTTKYFKSQNQSFTKYFYLSILL
jgi:hypothetical protein